MTMMTTIPKSISAWARTHRMEVVAALTFSVNVVTFVVLWLPFFAVSLPPALQPALMFEFDFFTSLNVTCGLLLLESSLGITLLLTKKWPQFAWGLIFGAAAAPALAILLFGIAGIAQEIGILPR